MPTPANASAVKMWRYERRLELIVNPEVVEEYLEVLERLSVHEQSIVWFEESLAERKTVTWVNLGPRLQASRDPDDNVFLSTARPGRADYLLTNDRDLLDIPLELRRNWRCEVVRPSKFLASVAEG